MYLGCATQLVQLGKFKEFWTAQGHWINHQNANSGVICSRQRIKDSEDIGTDLIFKWYYNGQNLCPPFLIPTHYKTFASKFGEDGELEGRTSSRPGASSWSATSIGLNDQSNKVRTGFQCTVSKVYYSRDWSHPQLFNFLLNMSSV